MFPGGSRRQIFVQRARADGEFFFSFSLSFSLSLSLSTGGIFKAELFLPDDYPMTPPKIRFLTRIYHPNIDKLGRICLDVLKSEHRPRHSFLLRLLFYFRGPRASLVQNKMG